MTENLTQIRYELALANRILSNENIVDAFGHASVRNPHDHSCFLISSALPPEVVETTDLLEITLDGHPVQTTGQALYSENVIHSEIYRARPDVMAICHHHAADILPYCISDVPLQPVFQLGGVLGDEVAVWNSRDDFGDTNLLLVRPEEGRSLAAALGPNWIVLMRHHGATVVGRSLREMVFRSVYSALNARLLTQARQLGAAEPISAGELALCSRLSGPALERYWQYAVARLTRSNGIPAKEM